MFRISVIRSNSRNAVGIRHGNNVICNQIWRLQSMTLHRSRGRCRHVQVNTTPYYKQTDLLNHNKENNTIMKLLTYVIMPNISSWLRVTRKYKNIHLSNTLKCYPKHNSTHGPCELAWVSPKPNCASQPGHNFGPSKLLRLRNHSVLGE
jgi:hypothetical protein